MKENALQTKMIKWINAQPRCRAENVSGNAQQSGRADINACIHGRAVKIEVKRPDSSYDVTKKQEIYLYRWAQAGAYCCSVETLEDLQRHIVGLIGRM